MSADQQLMDEYIRIVNQIEVQPRRELLERLFGMADQNFPPAMHTLSVCLEQGIGLVKDEDAAFQYCLAAAKLGNPAALNNMGCNYFEGKNVDRDPYKALAYFNSAAKAGYVQAAHSAGYLLDHGADGVEADGEKALSAYMWAFRHGHIRSANNIGIYFLKGKHTSPDPANAKEWLLKGIAAGDPIAQKNLERLRQLERQSGPNAFREARAYAKIWLDGDIF